MGGMTGLLVPTAPSRGLVWMIGLAVALNYVDRGAVSVAAPLIQSDLGLTATGYGLIVSAFFWSYVPCLAVAGWLADRMSVHRLMAGGVALWAIATACAGFAGSATALVLLRLVMGVGEGVAFPCGAKLLARAPEAARGRANVALGAGIALGPFLGTLAGGALLASFGWRPMFIVFGLGTLLWLLPWQRLRTEVDSPPEAATPAALSPMGWPAMLRERRLWAMVVLHFCGSYGIYFLIAWLPLWLVRVRGFDIADMALITAMFYLVQAASGWAAAAVTDRMIEAGGDASRVRRLLLFLCVIVAIAGLLALPATTSTPLLVLWLAVASLGFGPIPNLLYTFGQMLAGPASAGRFVGMLSALGNLSGVIGPVVTGALVDAAGYGPPFLLTAGVMAVGALVFAVGVPRLAAIKFEPA